MICKNTLDRLGKAAYNALSDEDKLKYTTASSIVAIISKCIANSSSSSVAVDAGLALTNVGLQVGSAALILLSNSVTGKESKTITEAINALTVYVMQVGAKLIDQVKHEIAAKLAVLFGIDENPGVLGAILEWVFKAIVKPTLA